MVPGSTQPLTYMSTRNLSGGKGRAARKADKLTAICEPIVKRKCGSPTSQNPLGLHGLFQGQLYLLRFYSVATRSFTFYKYVRRFILTYFQVRSGSWYRSSYEHFSGARLQYLQIY
jgi:hypothetical protein